MERMWNRERLLLMKRKPLPYFSSQFVESHAFHVGVGEGEELESREDQDELIT